MYKRMIYLAAIVGGGVCFTLRSRMYSQFLEAGNLLAPNPIAGLLWIISGVCVAAFAAAVLAGCRLPFMITPLRGVMETAFAGGILLCALLCPKGGLPALENLILPLGILGSLGMLYCAVCHLAGRKTHFAGYIPALVFLLMFMIFRYRIWSARPQLMDYSFDMLACTSLALSLYWRIADGVGMGRTKPKTFFSLCTIFFGLTAMAHGESPVLYLTGAMFALTSKER